MASEIQEGRICTYTIGEGEAAASFTGPVKPHGNGQYLLRWSLNGNGKYVDIMVPRDKLIPVR